MTAHPVPPAERFARTRWTLVGHAMQASAQDRQRALRELATQYRYPVYAYLRRCGHPAGTADAVTAGFLSQLLDSTHTLHAARDYPRFRDFLLQSLDRFLSADWREPEPDPATDDDPGGADIAAMEQRYLARLQDDTPRQAFQRGYALEVVSRAFVDLRLEAVAAGREAMFDALAPLLGRDATATGTATVAVQLSMRPSGVDIALQRLRQRFRELVRREIEQTVSDEAQFERECVELLATTR